MSKRYSNNRKKSYKRTNGTSIWTTVLIVALILAFAGASANLFKDSTTTTTTSKEENTPLEYTTVYFVPSEEWAEDGSAYIAWGWSYDGLPYSQAYCGTDADEDGVWEFQIIKEHTKVLFIDLKPDTTELGTDWVNMRAQSDDLTIPTDDCIYYHLRENEWSNVPDVTDDSADNVTVEELTVYLNTTGWTNVQQPSAYVFDSTEVKDAMFIETTEIGDNIYSAVIPVGYTHVIFLEYNESGVHGSWDNVANQTADLLVPTDENVYYIVSTSSWSNTSNLE